MSEAAEVAAAAKTEAAAASVPCAACGAPGMTPFHEVASVPTNSCILVDTRLEARTFPRGEVRLACCERCGFIANVAFEPALTTYSGRYEETQAYSPTFSAFHESLARELVERWGVRGADVLEIGCGKGEFLGLLARLGGNRCLGFDPSYDPRRPPDAGEGSVSVRREFFTEAHGHLEADLVVCKMTLEHIAEPRPLLAAMRRVAARRPGALVFVQVPDVTRILEECAFEDVYYEHCAYYGPGSLARLFHREGFGVRALETVYHGQYLTLVAAASHRAEDDGVAADDLATHLAAVADFGARSRAKREAWQARFDAWRRDRRRVVLWGSGSKAVAFLGALDTRGVERVVDINPHRQGHFMPGSGEPIVAPADLTERPPDVVVVVNRVYVDEIRSTLGGLGLAPEVVAL